MLNVTMAIDFLLYALADERNNTKKRNKSNSWNRQYYKGRSLPGSKTSKFIYSNNNYLE